MYGSRFTCKPQSALISPTSVSTCMPNYLFVSINGELYFARELLCKSPLNSKNYTVFGLGIFIHYQSLQTNT